MEPEDTRESSAEIEEVSAEPQEAEPSTVEQVRTVLTSGLNRRTFLAAAALGSAAAAMVNKVGPGLSGIRLGPLPAFADDLSNFPCTANDVRIAGTGLVLNEPCCCAAGSTFTAQVAFPVENTTGTERYCIALHLVGLTGIPDQDIILINPADNTSTLPRNSTTTMVGSILNFPCNETGVICTAVPTEVRGKCTNECSTVAFSTSPNAAGCTLDSSGNAPTPPRGQCRHQQICIQGFGATLECGTCASPLTTVPCTVPCGGTLTLRATVNAADASSTGTACQTAPFTYTLFNGTTQVATFGPTAAKCHDFTVTAAGSYTVQICDCRIPVDATCAAGTTACCRTSSAVTVTTQSITAHLAVSGNVGCNTGVLTFTGSATGCAGTPTFRFKVDSGSFVAGTGPNGDQFTYNPTCLAAGGVDTGCHTVTVEANCNGCIDTTSRTVSQCVTSTVGAEDTTC
jgi:hypothetical protein